MNIILTDPIIEDYLEFHDLIQEPDLQNQFHNYRGQTIEETKKEIAFWVENQKQAFPSFMRMIKLTSHENYTIWNKNNSKLIGFISNIPASITDNSRSGFKMLMNFGLMKKFEGQGIMTNALKMTLEKMYQFNYNIASAYVKTGNISSQKVLEKCSFDLVKEDYLGRTYVRALKIEMEKYKNAFGFK